MQPMDVIGTTQNSGNNGSGAGGKLAKRHKVVDGVVHGRQGKQAG